MFILDILPLKSGGCENKFDPFYKEYFPCTYELGTQGIGIVPNMYIGYKPKYLCTYLDTDHVYFPCIYRHALPAISRGNITVAAMLVCAYPTPNIRGC